MTVYLVGAGPGDPGLLTRRGAELLSRADVVVHDRLSAHELLSLAPPHAELIDVGKAPKRHRLAQAQINELLVQRGGAGEEVVRLKGGDPFVFARGSEECAALEAAGVPYEVVPGVSSALAVPAYGGIPVTQRFSSTSFTVVTGHEDPSSGEGTVDWDAVARTGGTIVILMGVGRWPLIAERLLAAGRDPDTPAAAVRWGTRPEQRTVRATLATLADHELESPSVIVVGAVAAERFDWFERRPLSGRRVVVTRARAQASALAERLRGMGAVVVEAPSIEPTLPSDGGAAIRDAVDRIGTYDWFVLTSPVGVARTFDLIPDVRVLAGVKVAVVGTGTDAALRRCRVAADLVPERFIAESLLEAFPQPPGEGGRVLVAVAENAGALLPDGLTERGWTVDVAHPYRTAPVPLDDETIAAVARADAVTFTSSSTVTNLLDAVGDSGIPPVVVTIGPVTSATAVERGLSVTAEADPHTIDALVDALVDSLT
ncbi:MAG: uroporphyrinogen-III C-methyltransferase [Acidimicrobiales bacterium]|nr:uroporphyrinogen-III C-methyltransferase [Acidimicrobiales bacterium]